MQAWSPGGRGGGALGARRNAAAKVLLGCLLLTMAASFTVHLLFVAGGLGAPRVKPTAPPPRAALPGRGGGEGGYYAGLEAAGESSSDASPGAAERARRGKTGGADVAAPAASRPPGQLKWAIFITPEGFVGDAARRQRLAIASWKRLQPSPRIVLAGEGAGYAEAQKEFGVEINPRIDLNLANMPLAGSLIDTAMHSTDADVVMILNSDIVLTQSIVDAFLLANEEFPHWFMTGARIDVESLPAELEPWAPNFTESGLYSFADKHGTMHTAGGADYFAWSTHAYGAGGRPSPLVAGHVPPFIRGKSKFDNWIVHEVIRGGFREVIDGTEAVLVLHINHKYKKATAAGGDAGFKGHKGSRTFWQFGKTKNWQIFHNVHLAIFEGTYQNEDGTTVHTPWKLALCHEPGGTELCLIERVRPGRCPCEHSPYTRRTQNDPTVSEVKEYVGQVFKATKIVKCGSVSLDDPELFKIAAAVPFLLTVPPSTTTATALANDSSVADPLEEGNIFGLPFTLGNLLTMQRGAGRHLLVTGVASAEMSLMMNFVCNLRRLGAAKSLIIVAFDEDVYRLGFRMGVPIFYQSSGRARYPRPALELAVMSRILQAGFNAAWVDISTVFFEDPTPALAAAVSDIALHPGFIVAPASAAAPPGAFGGLGHGVYSVRATPGTIDAVEAAVVAARLPTKGATRGLHALCSGGSAVSAGLGASREGCTYSRGHLQASISFLDANTWLAGGQDLSSRPGAVAALGVALDLPHYVARLTRAHLWFYDWTNEVCSYADEPLVRWGDAVQWAAGVQNASAHDPSMDGNSRPKKPLAW